VDDFGITTGVAEVLDTARLITKLRPRRLQALWRARKSSYPLPEDDSMIDVSADA